MRFTLFKKILISMLFISSLMVLGMAWLINHSFQTGLQEYLNQGEKEKLALIAEEVAPYYSKVDGWSGLMNEQWKSILTVVFSRSSKDGRRTPNNVERNERLLKRVVILDQSLTPVFKHYKPKDKHDQIKVPIKYQQQTIGWVVTKKRNVQSGALEKSFYIQQQYNFMWIVLWLTLLSFALAWLLVRHLLTPLQRLEKAANALQDGDYSTKIEVSGEDELAALSNRFNELSSSLLRQKESREQWLADISHELRTPISVLKSEIEALQDGNRQAEPKYIDSLHHQVQNLSQLVNDLYQLSLSDQGMQFDLTNQVNVQDIMRKTCEQYQLRCEEKNIKLNSNLNNDKGVWIKGDEKSLTQLFSNLLENSLRYTDAPGNLNISFITDEHQLKIRIEDSAPGVPDNALPKLFERLYRVDESRSRLSGGSGLGLSICKTIVNAHQGEIVATHSSLGGVSIILSLPLASV